LSWRPTAPPSSSGRRPVTVPIGTDLRARNDCAGQDLHDRLGTTDGEGVSPLPTLERRRPGRQPVHELLATGGVHCVYQPVVELATGSLVGREALMRTPEGSGWDSPLDLLDGAERAGLLCELETASMRAALTDAERTAAGAAHTLFLNIEPRTLSRHLPAVLETLDCRAPGVRIVVEITERALASDPAGILDAADRLREVGCVIALDDVGAEPASLAFLALLAPEVIKLDLGLLRTLEDPATITVADAVRARAEATGARVVAEGIETRDDLTRALVLGADLGQGWYLGRPHRPVPEGERHTARIPRSEPTPSIGSTPFEVVAARRAVRPAPTHLLLPLSRTLEASGVSGRVPPLVLGSFQDQRFFTGRTSERYRLLAERLPFVGGLGVGVPADLPEGVRWAEVAGDDPLSREWSVVVLGAHDSVALVGRELGAGRPGRRDAAREFAFAVTHDQTLVTAAARSLLERFRAEPFG
jgi:EAL domain-containing protein (putative c-di-GMP-specific phosphodiesterase class I)